ARLRARVDRAPRSDPHGVPGLRDPDGRSDPEPQPVERAGRRRVRRATAPRARALHLKGDTALHALHVLVMAGGRGTRFWPKSRRSHPKQVLPLLEEGSLLEATLDRIAPLVPPERVLVVTGREMEASVKQILAGRVPLENVMVEPHGRNTAPAIGWGAVEIGRRGGGQAVMAVLPSDHTVERPDELRKVLTAASRAASETNALITLGMRPTRPETG